MDQTYEINTNFLIIAAFILIAKLTTIVVSKANNFKKSSTWFFFCANQPYVLALLIFTSFIITSVLTYQPFLSVNYAYIYNSVTALVNFSLITAIVLKEEKLLHLYFLEQKSFNNKTLQLIMPLIWHSIRLGLIIIALLILFPNSIFPPNIQYFFNKLILIFIIWCISWLLCQLLFSFENVFFSHYKTLEINDFQARGRNTRIKIIKSILIPIIIIIAIACTCMVFKKAQNVGASIFASAGVITAIVGISAQKSIGNLMTGLQTAISQPIKINDFIVIEGESGTVEEISLTYVVVKTWDLRRLIVPINYFSVQPFVNLTRSSTNVLCPIVFYTDYSLPVDKVRSFFFDSLELSELWDRKVATFAIIDATEETIKVRALASARTNDDSSTLKYEMYEKLIGYIYKNFPECLPRKRIIGNKLPPTA